MTKAELLALTPGDFDFEKQTLRINKTFHRFKGKDIITTPKTVKSNRIITLPPFLCDEIKDYLGMFYEIGESERMFSFTKSYLGHEMERGCKASGVKKIRIHDLRHSHVSLLINMGFGDAIPNKFCPVYTQGGTCSTNSDFNGAPAGFSRISSGNERVLIEKDAMAIGRFQ